MKNLNWFQARGLALERRAVRRENWAAWLLYRFKVWIISSLDTDGNEVRRVVQAQDFRDSEFLAKDWTDEPWTGATYPPCTVPGPALVAAGDGAWTFHVEQCGGDGEGGGVPPPFVPEALPPGSGLITGYLIPIPTSGGSGTVNNPEELTPDGPGCWVAPPEKFNVFLRWTVDPSAIPGWDPTLFTPACTIKLWYSATGIDFTAVDASEMGSIAGATALTDGGVPFNSGGLYPDRLTHWLYYVPPGPGQDLVPGATVTARMSLLNPAGDEVTAVANLSYIFAPFCGMS